MGVTKPEQLEGESGRPGRSLEQVVSAGMSQRCPAKEGRMEKEGAETWELVFMGSHSCWDLLRVYRGREARVGHEGRLMSRTEGLRCQAKEPLFSPSAQVSPNFSPRVSCRQLSRLSVNAAIKETELNVHGCVPIKLFFLITELEFLIMFINQKIVFFFQYFF